MAGSLAWWRAIIVPAAISRASPLLASRSLKAPECYKAVPAWGNHWSVPPIVRFKSGGSQVATIGGRTLRLPLVFT
jgi:hypothetical protein